MWGFFGVMKMFLNYIVVMVAQSCVCIKNHQIIHFKMKKLMVCKLYLDFL